MSMLGRNDPCHCGSGKKYKKCHWAADQQAAAERANRERARQERLAAMGQPSDSEMRQIFQTMTGRIPGPGPLPAEARTTITELWQQERLANQAREALEPVNEEWERYFEENPEAFELIANELAADPFFDQYELTEENQEKVRQELGPLPDDEEALQQYVSEAIALTLDEEDRSTFNQALLSLLPDLVEEDRLQEAYVIATCADRVLEPEAPISPFLRDVVTRSMRNE